MARQPSVTRALPAPVGGWDTREALADMPADRASKLDNFFPSTDKVASRPGYSEFARISGDATPVETLLPYVAADGSAELFACAGTSIFDVTGGGTAGAAVVSSTGNARWQHVQITTSGGQFLFACNGEATPQIYNGTAWADTTLTGPTVTNLVWCNTHARRLWFGEADSLSAWYLDVNAITGLAVEFPLGAIATRGGYIMAMGTWSRDGGTGPQDLAAFITSEGEVIIYAGIDPSDPDLWQLVGVFRLGRPIGRRCFIKAASDLILITEDGFQSLSSILSVDRTQAEKVALSAQIARAVNSAVRLNGTRFGWQPVLYPRGQMMLVNSPISDSAANQFVFNTVTGAPCRFVNIPAVCWGLAGETLYFGTSDGRVCQFDDGYTDAGASIRCEALQAYNYFGSPAQIKRFGHIEPIFESLAQPNAQADLAIDFRAPIMTAASEASAGNTGVGVWGVSAWGVGTWGSEFEIWDGWRGAYGVGRAAAVRMVLPAATARTAWIATNVQMTPGGAF